MMQIKKLAAFAVIAMLGMGGDETVFWCPERGSNPHGLAAEGF